MIGRGRPSPKKMPWGEVKRGYLSHEHWSGWYLRVRDFVTYWARSGEFRRPM